jgi:maltose alpha-D-glucosyltransferase/alpha-amylase
VLVLAPGWQQALERGGAEPPKPGEVLMQATHEKMRDEILVPYLRARRWFAARNEPLADVRVTMIAPWKTGSATWSVTFMRADLADGSCQRYFVPLALDWETRSHDPLEKYAGSVVARVRHRDRVGVFYAAFADPEFTRGLARAMGTNSEVALGAGKLRFSSTSLYAANAAAIDAEDVRVPAVEQSNTAVFFGNKLFLKGYRRMREGVNPELELGRFLTEVSPFPHVAPVLGAVEYVEGNDEPVTLAVLQKFVENQGDLWELTLQHLGRMLVLPQPKAAETAGAAEAAEAAATDFHLGRMALLGRRVGELHRALAARTGDPAFDPEPITARDIKAWKALIEEELDASLKALEAATPSLKDAARAAAERLVRQRKRLCDRIRHAALPERGVAKTRFHGDLHLGQVLVAQDDFVIVDFEGEPARPVAARRAKSSVLRDVAGMLRSFGYAAHAARLKCQPDALSNDAALATVAEWQRGATHHFREGYLKATAGLESVPADASAFQATLDLFLIEKALYELRYELAQRPDWVAIPLNGLLELSEQ